MQGASGSIPTIMADTVHVNESYMTFFCTHQREFDLKVDSNVLWMVPTSESTCINNIVTEGKSKWVYSVRVD